jgi:hypothetical protein
MDEPEAPRATIWMDRRRDEVGGLPADYWSKLDVTQQRVRSRSCAASACSRSGDHHSVQFMPGFVHPAATMAGGTTTAWKVTAPAATTSRTTVGTLKPTSGGCRPVSSSQRCSTGS